MTKPYLSAEELLLDYYHCTFFLPITDLTENIFLPKKSYRHYYNPQSQESGDVQAYHYFAPHIRQILFDNGRGKYNDEQNAIHATKEWRLPKDIIGHWELWLKKPDISEAEDKKQTDKTKEEQKTPPDPADFTIAKIDSISLYQYFNGIYILAFKVSPLALNRAINEDNPLYNYRLSHQQICHRLDNNAVPKLKCEQLIMEQWLRFTKLTRQLFAVYTEQHEENKFTELLLRNNKIPTLATSHPWKTPTIPNHPGENISPIIPFFIKQFCVNKKSIDNWFTQYSGIYDDRMFTSCAYGIAGKQLPEQDLMRLHTLASMNDTENDTFSNCQHYVYSPQVIHELLDRTSYKLWNSLGGYYGYTDFSNSYLYNSKTFRNKIAPKDVTALYDRMLIQALFYQASLRHYDTEICQQTSNLTLSDKPITNKQNAIRQQRKEFIQFTNQYWFHELTPQMQGKEIFRLQQQALGIKEHYEILKDELERTDEYIQTDYEISISNTADKVSTWGLMFALVAIYLSILPLLADYLKNDEENTSLWTTISQFFKLTDADPFLISVVVGPIAIGAIAYLIVKYKRKS